MGVSLLTFLGPVPISVFLGRGRPKPGVAHCCLQQRGDDLSQRKATRKKRKRPSQRAAAGSRPISEVSIGDEFVGTICDVGPADSSWVDIGVATLTGKTVRARLRFLPGEKDTENTDVIGGIVPVYVHKVNRPAARIEVRRGTPPVLRDEKVRRDLRMLDSVALAEELSGRVIAVGAYGAVVDVEIFRHGRHGRIVSSPGLLPRKLFKEEWASDADPLVRDDVEKVVRVGDRMNVWVRAVHVESGFLLLDCVPLSVKELEEERREKQAKRRRNQRRRSPDTLTIGERRFGRVREIAKFGLFVDIGVRTDGLIHYTEMGEKHRWDWKEAIGVGSEVIVEVLSASGNRIGLRLLFFGHEEAEENQEILSQASSPVARAGDIERAKMLRFVGHSEQESASVHSDSLGAKAGGTRAEQSEVEPMAEENVDSPSEESISRDEEDEGEEVEKFSDEYFEDKYGF